MTSLYSIAVSAENKRRNELMAGFVTAQNPFEARDFGIKRAFEIWPEKVGWSGHLCTAYELPPEIAKHIETVTPGAGSEHTIQLSLPQSLQRLSKINPSQVQEIVASQIELLTIYHNVVLDQAKRSFRSALLAAGVGLGFFLASVGFLLSSKPQANVAVISLISGALVEVISGINFYLYGKTSAQLADFQIRLDMTQRFLLANSICESLEGDFKQQTRSELVRSIAGVSSGQPNNNATPTQPRG